MFVIVATPPWRDLYLKNIDFNRRIFSVFTFFRYAPGRRGRFLSETVTDSRWWLQGVMSDFLFVLLEGYVRVIALHAWR
jgi:hypothetical protein